jgi:hypothetical protein
MDLIGCAERVNDSERVKADPGLVALCSFKCGDEDQIAQRIAHFLLGELEVKFDFGVRERSVPLGECDQRKSDIASWPQPSAPLISNVR